MQANSKFQGFTDSREPVKGQACKTDETFRCILCGSESCRVLFEARDRTSTIQRKFHVVKCTNCGLKSTVPQYSEEEIISLYPSDYSCHQVCPTTQTQRREPENSFKTILKSSLAPLINKLIDKRSWIIPSLPRGSRVLELGCATGSFLASLKDRGWDLYGVEPASGPARYAREALGLEVFSGTIKEAQYPSDSFDTVFSWMTVEHLPNPLETLSEVCRVLRKDGYFLLSVPNAGSWECAVFRSRWYALQVPFHLYHYAPKTISMLLEKAGFKIEKIEHQRNLYNVVASVRYVIDDLCGENRFSRYLSSSIDAHPLRSDLFLAPFAIALAHLRQGGRMTIVAKK